MRKRRRTGLTEPPVREFTDRGLKWLLVPENVRGLLLELSAEIAEGIDFSQMRPVPSSFIPDNLRKQEADVVYQAPYRSRTGE